MKAIFELDISCQDKVTLDQLVDQESKELCEMTSDH
jgi:hypothetical protein